MDDSTAPEPDDDYSSTMQEFISLLQNDAGFAPAHQLTYEDALALPRGLTLSKYKA